MRSHATRRYRIGRWLWLAGLISVFLWGAGVQAVARAPADGVTRWVTAAGGVSSGGAYRLRGAAGQPDVASTALSGGRYQLPGGFWQAAPNQAPIVEALADQTGQVNGIVALQVVARDPEGGALYYVAANLPPALQIDSATGLISGRLAAAGVGEHTVTVTITDVRGASAQLTFLFMVSTPTAIGIASLSGAYADGVVVVRWTTTWELDTYGFHLYRGETDDFAQALRLTTELILGAGSGGSDYHFVDTATPFPPGCTFWYWVEEVATTGATQRYWPVSVTIPPSDPPEWGSTLFLPMVAR